MEGLGFAEKYLAKCGYKGGGLGIHEQGIVDPIEAKLRPKNMGLGFTNHKPQQKFEKPSESSSNQKSFPNQTRKDKKIEYSMTPEELLIFKSNENRPIIPKIIDMTRPEVRVVTDLTDLNTSQYYDDLMPQVKDNYNVRFRDQYVDEKEVNRRNEMEREKEQYLANVAEITRVLGQIDECESLTLESLVTTFVDLQMRYVEEYVLLDLSTIACSYAVPLFTKMFQGWDMLKCPTHGVDILRMWKELLLGKDNSCYVYTQLVVDVVYPAVRVNGTNNWDVKDAEPMVKFLECWYELIPANVMQMILENVVWPKLLDAVMYWDPVSEVVPIDCWVHPWLPLLGDKLESCCFQTIRDGFARMLSVWKAADMYVYYALSPWKSVFGSEMWEKLMVRYVVPKLMSFMGGLQINRVECNKVDQFLWASVIPNHHMVRIMDVFFNKWQEVLYQWLRDNPNFEEVGRWYLGWKEELPPELEANEYIQYRLSIGLTMMDMAVEGLEVAPPCIQKNMDHLRKRERKCKRSAFVNRIHTEDVSGESQMSLKEAVEIFAQHNGLLFTPKFGRTKDGLQIYGFGKTSVVLDSLNQKVFARIENGCSTWSSVSLDQLLKLHLHAGS